MLVVLVLFIVIVALTRYVSLGSILACVAFPLAVWWLGPAERTTAPILLVIAASSLLIVVRHKDNIRRLLAGTENRFR
jgi:glycerol-3-phosphate acyltransferase PlsY